MLLTGIACFNLYLQSNYSGPDPGDLLPKIMALRGVGASAEMDDAEKSALETDIMNALSVGGELVTPVSKNLILFRLARDCFVPLKNSPHLSTVDVHLLRLHRRHFELLLVDSQPPPPFVPELWEEAAEVVGRLLVDLCPDAEENPTVSETIKTFIADKGVPALDAHKSATSLEIGLTCSLFEQHDLGKPFFDLAAAYSGMKWEVTGAEGKKTKFQTEDIAQMVVVAESAIEDPYEKDGGPDANEGEGKTTPSMKRSISPRKNCLPGRCAVVMLTKY